MTLEITTPMTEFALVDPVGRRGPRPTRRTLTWTEPVVLPRPIPRWLEAINAGGDLVGLTIGVLVGLGLRPTPLESIAPFTHPLAHGVGMLLVVPAVSLGHLAVLNAGAASRRRVTRSAMDEFPAVARGVSWAALVDLSLTFLFRIQTPRGLILISWLAGMLAVTVCRAVTIRIRQRTLKRAPFGTGAVVVGHGHLAERVSRELAAHPETGVRLVGSLGEQPLASVNAPLLGTTAELASVVSSLRIGEVLVTCGSEHSEALAEAVWGCGGSAARVSLVAPHPDLVIPDGDHDRIGSLPLIHARAVRSRWVARIIRDALDRLAALILLLLMLPVMIVAAAAVCVDSRGGPFYRQTRIGRDGRAFQMVKLRTMVADADSMKQTLDLRNEADGPLFKIRNDPRVTRVGRVLRRASLDEIPQLWHVVKGEMSLIGPRPPLPDEVALYPDWFRRRMAVRPGITGLWQVSGRAEVPFAEAMRLDLSYVEGWSPWLDVQILLRTVGVVIGGRGSY